MKNDVKNEEPTQTLSALGVLPAEHAGHRLLVFIGSLPTAHRLPTSGEVIVGRGDDVDIVIDDRSLSRRHARLVVDDRGVAVVDLGSTNGSRVRGVRVGTAPTRVERGEVFHLGHVTCAVEFVAVSSAAKTSTSLPSLATSAQAAPSTSAQAKLTALLSLVAPSELSVLLHGETGAGKEVAARALHAGSPRKAGPFVALNCAALPENLLESELFGYEKGAFSGADKAKPGLFESADGGTVFLDEVAEMSAAVQAKLLRVLEERQVQRLGALRPKAIDVRFVAASHKDLQDEVDANRFREDLYFRLNGITVEIPPLRERVDDIEPLALSFLAEGAKRIGKAPPALAPLALQKLRAHPWPGNVRELRTVIERAVVLSAGAAVVDADHIALNVSRAKASTSTPAASSTSTPAAPAHLSAAERAERERIIQALHDAAGNQTRAAELLGVSRRTLINRIEQYDVPRPRKS